MQIPETPKRVDDLDLVKRLAAYGRGEATWNAPLGEDTRAACERLHSEIKCLVEKALAPLLDRVTTREMETFTLHDRTHGLKVAHLMWHILDDERRAALTPPESRCWSCPRTCTTWEWA